MTTIERAIVLERLEAERPRNTFLRWSLAAFALLVAHAWWFGDFHLSDFTSERHLENLYRFAHELIPAPLQGQPWSWSVALAWCATLMTTKGWPALATTAAISISAIVLAGCAAAGLALPATRTFASPEPYLPHSRASGRRAWILWAMTVAVTRAFLIFLRAVPEYVWAFLLIAVVGPTPWAAVLALAIHNTGILGKLNAEAIENLDAQTLAALRALGAARRHIAVVGIVPAVIPRALLFLFYRWETCVREATVLGMLGIVSIGYYVQDARARQQYDVMLALILLSGAIVLIGDLLSAAAREAVRRSD